MICHFLPIITYFLDESDPANFIKLQMNVFQCHLVDIFDIVV